VTPLSEEELEREADAYDAAAFACEDIDGFCSASEWTLAAKRAWSPRTPSLLLRGDHGYAVFLRDEDLLMGFDVMWGFTCPLVGREGLARELAGALRDVRWRALLFPGVRPGSSLMEAVLRAFAGSCQLRRGPVLRRFVASIEGGPGGFLARRTGKLRSNLRRSAARARALGITFEPGDASTALARALAVERRSWKGPAGTGLLIGDMHAFYEELCTRLGARGALRAIFARRQGEDVGYILGGAREGTYRGFQFSYDERFAHVGLGGLLQLEQIAALAAEGVTTYDLGIDLPYKRHWADGPFDTVTLAALR
jgi:hypothetical protein